MRPRSLDFAEAFESHKSVCLSLIGEHSSQSLCEVGGGRNPLFSADEIAAMGVEYTVLDASSAELALAPAGVQRHHRDICAPLQPEEHDLYDFMFSKFLAEHVPDGVAFHRNVFAMLRPGGVAFHFYPTLYYPAFIANRLLPEAITWKLLRKVIGYDRKFPARYSKCYGPSRGMTRLLRSLGYEVLDIRPFYGSFYFVKLPLLRGLERRLSDWAARRRSPHLTSYAFLLVRKPLAATGG